MTFQNWKELNINGYDLKKLIRVSDGLILFEKNVGPDYSIPFWFDTTTANGDNVQFSAKQDFTPLGIQYSYDNQTWTDMPVVKASETSYNGITFNDTRRGKVYIRSKNTVPINPFDYGLRMTFSLVLPSKYNYHWRIGGNIHSILCKDFQDLKDLSNYPSCFANFIEKFGVSNADDLLLPSKNVPISGYYQLFNSSSQLGESTRLTIDAETIDKYGCHSLLFKKDFTGDMNFPNLKSVGQRGLYQAFQETKMKSLNFPLEPLSAVGQYVMGDMCLSCASLESVRGNIELSNQYAGYQMFRGCTSLSDVSELSIRIGGGTYLARNMFYGCSSLESMPTIIVDPEVQTNMYCFHSFFRYCTNLKNVKPLPAKKPTTYMYGYAFQGCTSLTDAPEIGLSSIDTTQCLNYMFSGCTNLSSVNVNFTKWPATVRTSNWLNGVSPTGVFICPQELEERRGVNYIPEGWTIVRK